jgi:hypothetical protein
MVAHVYFPRISRQIAGRNRAYANDPAASMEPMLQLLLNLLASLAHLPCH